MATDAEIVAWHRSQAAELAERARRCRESAATAFSRPYAKVMRAEAETSDTFAAHHTRAADAIQKNARLRAALAEIERYDRDLLRAHDGAFVMYDDVIAALRTPGAGGSHE